MANSCPSHPDAGKSDAEWRALESRSPVRIQWDPERDLHLHPLPYRTIQIGLSGEAVERYVSEWIVRITDLSAHADVVHDLVLAGELSRADAHLLRERPYTVGMTAQRYVAMERDRLLDADHEDHEEIVALLQEHPDGESVSYLRRAIALKPSLKHLDYDDYGSFYKKCLWALQEVGTPEALAVIEECAKSNDPALREQALHRLASIAADAKRPPRT